MRTTKLSFDCAVPYTGPQGSPSHRQKWILANKAFWEKQSHNFGEVSKACVEVLFLLGEAAMRVELIKISVVEANYTVGNEPGPRHIFKVHAFFAGIEEKFETDPLLVDVGYESPQVNARELLNFKRSLYEQVRRFAIRCTGIAAEEEREWRKLTPLVSTQVAALNP